MSTSMSQSVAAEYATRNNARYSLLLRLNASSFMDSGCDISFLSGTYHASNPTPTVLTMTLPSTN